MTGLSKIVERCGCLSAASFSSSWFQCCWDASHWLSELDSELVQSRMEATGKESVGRFWILWPRIPSGCILICGEHAWIFSHESFESRFSSFLCVWRSAYREKLGLTMDKCLHCITDELNSLPQDVVMTIGPDGLKRELDKKQNCWLWTHGMI